MPFGPRTILAALVAALALGAAGCGSSEDKSIPPSSSEQLLGQLEEVQNQVDADQCELAKSGAIRFKDSLDSLPSDVDASTEKDLNELADNLIELTNDPNQCTTQEGATGESSVAETDTSASDEATSTTTTSSTTTPEESTTKPEEVEPAEPQPTGQSAGSQGDQGNGVTGDLGGSGGASGSTGGVKPKKGGR